MSKEWWKAERKTGEFPVLPKRGKLAAQYRALQYWAIRFDCGYDLLYKASRKGDLEVVYVGRSLRASEEGVRAYLDFCRKRKGLG